MEDSNLGRGAQLAKFDLENAYRMIPVHPNDRKLLGMKWKGTVWLDSVFPFGLRSAPKIFNVMADYLQWVLEDRCASKRGVESCHILHYLDDGPPNSKACGQTLSQSISTCQELGVRLSLNKVEGPTSQPAFLSIWLDTDRLEIRLPKDKLERLEATIQEWRG